MENKSCTVIQKHKEVTLQSDFSSNKSTSRAFIRQKAPASLRNSVESSTPDILTFGTKAANSVAPNTSITDALIIKASWPQCAPGKNIFSRLGQKRFNNYYDLLTKKVFQYGKKVLLPRVQLNHLNQIQTTESKQRCPFSLTLEYKTTYEDENFISIYVDVIEETGGKYRTITRFGDTWEKPGGWPLKLTYFFPHEKHVKKIIMSNILELAEIDAKLCHEDFGKTDMKKLRRYFSSENYYLTDGKITIFYPQSTIKSQKYGIPSYSFKNDYLQKSAPSV